VVDKQAVQLMCRLKTRVEVFWRQPIYKNRMRPVHPGEVLLEDYIKPMGMSVREIVDGNRGVSSDTALRLER